MSLWTTSCVCYTIADNARREKGKGFGMHLAIEVTGCWTMMPIEGKDLMLHETILDCN